MDFMPTKGVEYLIILAYLTLLVPFWFVLSRLGRAPRRVRVPAGAAPGTAWFNLPQDFHFHRGHTWARPDEDGSIRVGMDDFAQRLLGIPESYVLPTPGTRLSVGGPGWHARIDGHDVPLLSPVEGVVTEVNPEVRSRPDSVAEDPYGKGWLLKLRSAAPDRALANLMPHDVARGWMEAITKQVSRLAGPELGTVLQDGGRPVPGFVRYLGGDRWPELAAELLLTEARGNGENGTSRAEVACPRC